MLLYFLILSKKALDKLFDKSYSIFLNNEKINLNNKKDKMCLFNLLNMTH